MTMQSPQAKLVQSYLKKVKENGTAWKRTLARKIYEKNTDKFTSIDNVRDYIRRYTGTHGSRTRKHTNTYTQLSSAKILIFDIETAPIQIKANVFSIWEQNIPVECIEQDWFVLSWSAKWLFDKKIHSDVLTPKEANSGNDKRIMKALWNLLHEADIVIAHNGDKFDIKKCNTRFLMNGLNPTSPYVSIDTLKHIKKKFAFTSNKLNYINDVLELSKKMEHEGKELWDKCVNGDSESLKKMHKYNIQDVVILEELYLRIRAWIQPHPNVGLHVAESILVCPSCGCSKLNKEGTYQTQASIFTSLRCTSCGAVSRERKAVKTKVKNYLSINR